MQRLHQDDLVGHVLEREGWDVVCFPAIAEANEEHVVETPFGTAHFKRSAGDLLHPERESKEILEQMRRAIGEYPFAGQYQQAPAPLGGGMIKEQWFKRYGANELPDKFDQLIQSWDSRLGNVGLIGRSKIGADPHEPVRAHKRKRPGNRGARKKIQVVRASGSDLSRLDLQDLRRHAFV
jgi:hypothetical protein